MENTQLGKFNQTIAEITSLVEESKKIVVTDLNDKVQVERAKNQQKKLADLRNDIKDCGIKFRRQVRIITDENMATQKDFLEMIEPEEERLKKIDAEVKEIATMKKRKKQLPERLKKLEELNIDMDEAEILQMDDKQFDIECSNLVTFRNEQIAERNRKKQVELDKKENKIKQARAVENAKKAGKKQAIADQHAKDKADTLKKVEDEKLLASRKEYQKFRDGHGWTKETENDFCTKEVNGVIHLFKKVGEYKK